MTQLTEAENDVIWALCEDCDVPIFRHYAWSHQGGTPPQGHEAAPHQALDPPDEGIRLCICGLPMSPNNHPEAGKPGRVNDIGPLYVCIPCLSANRNRWATRAWADEREIVRLREKVGTAARMLERGIEGGTPDAGLGVRVHATVQYLNAVICKCTPGESDGYHDECPVHGIGADR